MFDLAGNDGSVRKLRYKSPIPDTRNPDPPPLTSVAQLEAPRMANLHRRLLHTYLHELDRQHDNRIEQATEDDFYDNIQWREDDARAVEDRGQFPIVYNVISASIDWVLGTEKRSRADYKVLPRRKNDGKPAERKSQLLKYLSDVNRSPFHISRAFADAVKVGVGWMEDGWGAGDDEEPIYARYENWRNILWDSASTELDLADARYVFRSKWVDLDIACALFKKREALLERSVREADIFAGAETYGDEAMDMQEDSLSVRSSTGGAMREPGFERQRLRMVEGWIRMPVDCAVISGGSFGNELFDAYSPGHVEAINSGESTFKVRTMMRMFVSIFTEAGLVYFGPSPYRHNRFPLTPIWGKRRARDQLPYGMIRGLKDIQDDINKRASKALYIMSSNKIILETDTIPEGVSEEEFAEEAAHPDAFLVKNKGTMLELNAETQMSQWQLEMMSRDISMIQQNSGVTDELLGRETGAKSGIAIQRRQDQGSMATATYFDNLRLAMQISGEKRLSLIEQFMGEEKTFRITNMRGNPEYPTVNDGLPENDIVRSKADYVISEADWRATQRQAAVDQLLDAMSKFPPEVSLILLDLVVDDMDLAHREEIVRRIRGITGQRDPDAEEPTPEEAQQMRQAAEQQQIQRALVMANLKKVMAEANVKDAQAKEILQKVQQGSLDALLKALNAGGQAIQMPAAAHVADFILQNTGNLPEPSAQMASADPIGLPPGLDAAPPPQPSPDVIGTGVPA